MPTLPKPNENNEPRPEQAGRPDDEPRSLDRSTVSALKRSEAEPQISGIEQPRARFADPFERWGLLPMHAREIFRNQGGPDLPPEYRDWIDQYYRRLNARR